MKIRISRLELVDTIGKIQSVVPSKPAIPILGNILIETSDQGLILSTTDLTVSMKAQAKASINEPGSIALPARRFFQLIRELTSPEVEIDVSASGIATITSGSSKFKLHGMPKDEYPQLNDYKGDHSIEMNASTLKRLFGSTAFAAAKDDSRQVLNGIFMQVEDGTMTFVGTDGKRLAKIRHTIDDKSIKLECIIPLKAVEQLLHIIGEETSITLHIKEGQIGMECGSVVMTSKLLSGQYPDVDRVIPAIDNMKKITLHKDELTSLLKQVSLFTSEMNYSVRFTFESGELKLQAVSSEIGEGNVNMPVNYSEEKIEIAFNPYFFIDILKHCKDETATFGVTDSYNPGMLTDSSNAQYVIMPMRLSND